MNASRPQKPLSYEPVKTTCPFCGVGCGIEAQLDETGLIDIRGDAAHPANAGRLCAKGAALGDTTRIKGRLLYPEVLGQQVSWELALCTVAGRLDAARKQFGPDSVAFLVSGQLMTEDLYVANKLMKGFIGSANIDSNSRLSMAPVMRAYQRSFGEDIEPCSIADIDDAEMIVLTGSNAAHCHPVLYERIAAAKKRNPELTIVVIDPRTTTTAKLADLHLPIRPGSDVFLFNGLREYLAGDHANNGVDKTAELCELDSQTLEGFYDKFAATEKVISIFSQGINKSASGGDAIDAIVDCHLLTGRIGKAGMGPFFLSGQPNAMGGREVGAFADQLASHLQIDKPDDRALLQRFWNSPALPDKPGLTVEQLCEALEAGDIKALWIMGANPAASLPDAERIAKAIGSCEFVVVSDSNRETDTVELAHVRLPSITWGERDGTVTNLDRTISRQRQFLPIPGLAKPDWQIVCEVADLMGWGEHFNYDSPARIFREHAALSTFENRGVRLFNLGTLAAISDTGYQELQPVRWRQPLASARSTAIDKTQRADKQPARPDEISPNAGGKTPPTDYPFMLNTIRVRDHWHTMTRTGYSAKLSSHTFEPFVEIHPQDAALLGFQQHQLARVESPTGQVIARVLISETQRAGSVSLPLHWNKQFSGMGNAAALIGLRQMNSAAADYPAVRLHRFDCNWYGFVLTRHDRLALQYSTYWSRTRGPNLWRYEIAGFEQPPDWAVHARRLLCGLADNVEWLEQFDQNGNCYQAARIVDKRLDSFIYISPGEHLPPRQWLTDLFDKPALEGSDRACLLCGNLTNELLDMGRTVCPCHDISES
ncbi:MAG: molybdopterin-dependent oxidoreductase, partial [Gammaproteobacteria bacterium]|nr:molybdopterin-dependent oxidoreductase [Gammaproteobacteria bacterium]